MALSPLLVLSAALLGSVSGSSKVTPLTRVVVNACMEGAEQTLTGELKTGLEQVQQQATALQEQQLERLAAVQEQLQEQLAALHGVQETVQEQLQEQLAALQRQQTSAQQQLTSAQQNLQQQLVTVKEQLTAVQKQLPPAPPSSVSCPASWLRRGDNCYLIPPAKATWLGAFQACSAFDPRARLVSIHQSNKNYVNSLLKASGERDIWIGLFRQPGRTDTWSWTDGAPVDYTNWWSGEPNNNGDDEFCVSSYGQHRGTWNDRNGEDKYPFMCQISLK